MRKLIMAAATVSMLGLGATSGTVAAPVPGFEGLYSTLIASCSLPDGTEVACEAAITAYADALVAAVDIEVANQSFSEARQEVFALNTSDETFQAAIDALFELLLPDSGAIGAAPGVTDGGTPAANDGSGGPVPSSPVT